MPSALYTASQGSPFAVDHDFYQAISVAQSGAEKISEFTVEKRSGRAWTLQAGQLCRIATLDGPQVVDFNAWHAHNPRERFWASRTRQLVGAHVDVFDQLWSCLPYLRPMLTVTDETIRYGIDSDGAGCHDLLGTRCDPYVHQMLTGEALHTCCHSNLVRAVAPFHLDERDVHDVINIFQLTGLTAEEEKYFVKPCPAKAGDYFEFFAEIDLLCALSACPHGDMSVDIWGEEAADASEICRDIQVAVYQPQADLLKGWQAPAPAAYSGLHGWAFAQA